jgi:hypothetical protein
MSRIQEAGGSCYAGFKSEFQQSRSITMVGGFRNITAHADVMFNSKGGC